MDTFTSTKQKTSPTVVDDIDDLEAHAFDCACDECCENLWLSIMEDRA